MSLYVPIMKTVRMKVDLQNPASFPKGRVDHKKLDRTTEEDLAKQQAADDAEAMQDAARFSRRVRMRLGLPSIGSKLRP